MKISKIILLSCIALFQTYSIAHAEDQLFPTFILDKGNFDAEINLNHSDAH